MNLIRAGAEYKWDINLGEVSRIWKGGCIIRAQFSTRSNRPIFGERTCQSSLDADFKEWYSGAAALAKGCRDGAVDGYPRRRHVGEPGLLRYLSSGQSAAQPDAGSA